MDMVHVLELGASNALLLWSLLRKALVTAPVVLLCPAPGKRVLGREVYTDETIWRV